MHNMNFILSKNVLLNFTSGYEVYACELILHKNST